LVAAQSGPRTDLRGLAQDISWLDAILSDAVARQRAAPAIRCPASISPRARSMSYSAGRRSPRPSITASLPRPRPGTASAWFSWPYAAA